MTNWKFVCWNVKCTLMWIIFIRFSNDLECYCRNSNILFSNPRVDPHRWIHTKVLFSGTMTNEKEKSNFYPFQVLLSREIILIDRSQGLPSDCLGNLNSEWPLISCPKSDIQMNLLYLVMKRQTNLEFTDASIISIETLNYSSLNEYVLVCNKDLLLRFLSKRFSNYWDLMKYTFMNL